MGSSEKNILQTLAYSDIFDYPLSQEEIWRFLILKEKISKKEFKTDIKNISKKIILKNNLYCLNGREQIIDKRIKREKESLIKIKIAQKIASIFSVIPTIYLIGVSGALAMKNSDKNDDIDLFIIVKKGKLWVTRIILLIFLEISGNRRKREDKNVSNKICLNMFIDEHAIKMPKERQNLYSAHEVVQMLPLFQGNNMYSKFINVNKPWIEKFLPNSFEHVTTQNTTQNYSESFFGLVLRKVLFNSAFEYLSKKIQMRSIKKHQTIETVSDQFLAFHPLEYRDVVIKEYNQRLKEYKIL